MSTPEGRAAKLYHNRKRKAEIKRAADQSAIEKIREIRSKKTRCFWCGKKIDGGNVKECHIDHIMPLTRSKMHTAKNLVASCVECNLRKNDKPPCEFIKELGDQFYGVDHSRIVKIVDTSRQLQLGV